MKIHENKGTTLLEVMISMIILGLGILGLVPLIGLSIYNNTYSNDITVANALAQGEVETLLNMGSYGQLPFMHTRDSVDGIFAVNQRVDDNSTDGSVPAGVYKIGVNIAWTDQQNILRSINYCTLKPKQ